MSRSDVTIDLEYLLKLEEDSKLLCELKELGVIDWDVYNEILYGEFEETDRSEEWFEDDDLGDEL